MDSRTIDTHYLKQREALNTALPIGVRQVEIHGNTFHCHTKVTFYPMTEKEIDNYVATGDCMDKAGAYGIQSGAAKYIQGIEGDYLNVVGLPLSKIYHVLREKLINLTIKM